MMLSHKRRLRILSAVIAMISLTAAIAMTQPASATPTTGTSACGPALPGHARCFAEYTTPRVHRDAVGSPRAVSPADIKKAYGLPATKGSGAVVAIVDAYDNPNAESVLANYRARYGLPACTTDNGCFRKVNQAGNASPLPAADTGWGLEIALDLDAVSAACPNCSILLVEANSSQLTDLGLSVNKAVALGAKVVSNSYGADEDASVSSDSKKYYTHPGVPILASTGDDGFESVASFPAVSSKVIAVGGTTLKPNPSAARGWTETAWAGAGSSCSAYVAKPAWQKDTHCRYRTISDIAADADSASGLLVEDTFGFDGMVQVGGTSLSSPLVAAMMAMTDTTHVNDASTLYRHAGAANFNDVTSGSNGFCGNDYLCTGKAGYDGPTGLGTPHGIAGL